MEKLVGFPMSLKIILKKKGVQLNKNNFKVSIGNGARVLAIFGHAPNLPVNFNFGKGNCWDNAAAERTLYEHVRR